MKNKQTYTPFQRLGKFPLDASSLFETKEDAEIYLASERNTAYPGQVISISGGGVYQVIETAGGMELEGIAGGTTFNIDVEEGF